MSGKFSFACLLFIMRCQHLAGVPAFQGCHRDFRGGPKFAKPPRGPKQRLHSWSQEQPQKMDASQLWHAAGDSVLQNPARHARQQSMSSAKQLHAPNPLRIDYPDLALNCFRGSRSPGLDSLRSRSTRATSRL